MCETTFFQLIQASYKETTSEQLTENHDSESSYKRYIYLPLSNEFFVKTLHIHPNKKYFFHLNISHKNPSNQNI